ncbi:hypothetical protein TBR22_A30230 [Luteitalea sp. TBR-22]|uniref:ATP-binding protein n=1 Tax=Luteitalea sp. TBR-22 TaxID=2802971 RepID=UPI001AF81DED|nr:ATP-binding protein [Luteitalea sp. TBR-22]BCS33795.1 hypothetical protein TBR22_A30230 [Luteitalea sp. TBR-22]
MTAAPLPHDEAERLRALDRYAILDSPPEADFDDLTAIAAAVCGTPIALLSLVDRDRQWFKSRYGLDVAETARELAFCAHAILQADVFEVADALEDPRFADSALVNGAPFIRSYAGMPLETPDGQRLGTLCVIDRQPRTLTPLQHDVLRRLARQAVAQLELRRTSRLLRDQSDHLRALASVVTRTSNPVSITDADRRLTWVNPAFEATTGFTLAEATGHRLSDLLRFEELDPGQWKQVGAALDARKPVRTRLLSRRADGQRFWDDVDIAPLFDETQTFVGYCAIQSDVTALVQAEQAQRIQLALSQAVAAVQQGLIDGAALGTIVERALERAMTLLGGAQGLVADVHGGYGAEHLTARALLNSAWTPEERDRQRQRLEDGVRWRTLPGPVRSAVASGRATRLVGDEAQRAAAILLESSAPTSTLALLPVTTGGRTLALLAIANPCEDVDDPGTLLAPLLAVVGEAITSHRQAEARRLSEQALEQERRRLRLALLASNVGVFELDVASGELSWDWRMWDMHGVEPRTTGWTLADWVSLLHPEDADRAIDEFVATSDSERLLEAQYRIVRPDGCVRHLRANGQVFESDGRRVLLGVNLDVTGDVELQHELNDQRLKAESATAAKAQFLATMSHEIRTPMNGVLGMLELLLRSDLTPEQHETATMAHVSASALLHILNDILDLSKLEAQQVVLETIAFEPSRLVGDTLALLSPRALEKHLTLASEVDPALPAWLEADPTRIRQVLLNLVGNAIKFTARGDVRVRLRRADTHDTLLRVEVQDSGEGISPEVQARLFQRFVQADASTTRRHGGTGLGLAICRQLVELMGGEIGVESVPGEGSLFWFTVPVRVTQAPARRLDVQHATAPVALQLPLRILVAEDNLVNQRLVRAFLAPGRHEVVMVGDGAAAVAALDEGTYDVVLMDVQMPGMDGLQATAAIRARTTPDHAVPIIALTANAMSGDRERYLASGFTDYVSKPMTMRSLTEALARVCAREGDVRRSA